MSQNSNVQPVVSVITVVYNGVETLERTMKSVIAQSYPFVEYIVVDGGSSDGTQELMAKYAAHISKWVSEPDKGLYHAMNKGMSLATGAYYWFINSGDEIAGPHILSTIFKDPQLADIYYGETEVVDLNGCVLGNRRLTPPKTLSWMDFRNGMLVSHQSVIVSKEVCGPFNTDYRLSADYEWVLNALKKASTIRNCFMDLSKFLEGGLTRKNILPGLKERFKIMAAHFGWCRTLLHHIPIGFRFTIYYLRHGRF